MAKHGITIPKRRLKLEESVEHPDIRRAKISDQVAHYLKNGGKITKIARGVSNAADCIERLHMSAATKKRIAGLKL